MSEAEKVQAEQALRLLVAGVRMMTSQLTAAVESVERVSASMQTPDGDDDAVHAALGIVGPQMIDALADAQAEATRLADALRHQSNLFWARTPRDE